MVNNRWARLSQNEKAELLGIYTSMGYNDLASIIAHYNSCGGKLKADGGPVTNTARYKSDAYLYTPPVNVGAPIEVPLRYKPLPDYGDYVPQRTTGMLEDIPIELGLEVPQRGYGVLMPDAPSATPTLDARQDAARRIMTVENSKNNVNGGYDAKTGRWYPHKSHEGGADTIAYGIKLSNGTPEAALALKQGYLTDEQAESAVDSLVQKYYDAAKRVYDGRYGAGEWDKLSDKSQSILVDYSYNPGLAKFPKLMEGFHSGNLDLIRENYKRYSGGKELGRNKVLLEELDTLENEYPIFRKNGGKLFEMGGPGDCIKEKAVDLWYRKNVKPKIDELGIDEVRNRLYRHISPYSYVEPDRRVKAALNDKEPEFENFQRQHEGNIFPADRDDIFATYLGIPLSKRRWAGLHPDGTYTNNSPYQVIDSEYRPSMSSNDNVDYKALTIDNFDKKRLMKMATEGGEDLSDYSIKHGNITPIFANYDKFRDVVRPPMNIGESRVSAALRKYFGPHTISVGVDPERGQYVSYYDKWDLSPFSGNGDDETRGLGTPIEFYDRIYYDDYYGVDSRPQNSDEFYGGYIMPTIITAKRKADGGRLYGDGGENKYPTSSTVSYLRGLADYALRRKTPRSFVESGYRPTLGDNGETFYTRPGLKNEVVLNLFGGSDYGKGLLGENYFYKDFDDAYNSISGHPMNRDMRATSNGTLGQYSVTAGADDRGRYLSFTDKFDHIFIPGDPIHIYDRIYEDEVPLLYNAGDSAIDLGDALSRSPLLKDMKASGGKIHIKPENRGKFTALKKRTGHSASWFKAHGTPAQKKMATFALNSKHWSHKHSDGGPLFSDIRDIF